MMHRLSSLPPALAVKGVRKIGVPYSLVSKIRQEGFMEVLLLN